MTNEQGRQEGIKGAVEDFKGRVKETTGTLLGNDQMQREGQAQRNKGMSQQQVAEHETHAEQARREASAAETDERRHQ